MILTAAALMARYKMQQSGQEPAEPIVVHDLALPDRPERSMMFDRNHLTPAVVVRTIGYTPFFIERIEFLQPDADQRLARYELVKDARSAQRAPQSGLWLNTTPNFEGRDGSERPISPHTLRTRAKRSHG